MSYDSSKVVYKTSCECSQKNKKSYFFNDISIISKLYQNDI